MGHPISTSLSASPGSSLTNFQRWVAIGSDENGWGIDSIVTLQGGQPFQLNYNGESDFSGGGDYDDRPDVVGPIKYNSSNPFHSSDLTSFAIPCTLTPAAQASPTLSAADCVPGTRHYGNEGRDALHGPSFKEWNFAIYKTTAIAERFTMQFRADFFNILNHPNFCNPFLPATLPMLATRAPRSSMAVRLEAVLLRATTFRSPPLATLA